MGKIKRRIQRGEMSERFYDVSTDYLRTYNERLREERAVILARLAIIVADMEAVNQELKERNSDEILST